MIHICFGLHDKTGSYSKFTGTAMLSIFENTNSAVTVHILHDNTLTADNRDRFIYLAGRYNQTVKFYNIEQINPNNMTEAIKLIPSDQTRFSIAMFYRFFIWQVLPADIEKIIYLDSDLIVNLDINKLWQIEFTNEPLGVVTEMLNGVDPERASLCCRDGFIVPENYFNSGVLLMNLAILRGEEETLLEGIKFRKEHPEYKLYDQEILNYCFSTRTLKLPMEFNCLVKDTRKSGDLTLKKRIYHYAGGKFGLGLDISDEFNRLWLRYFMKTPWFNEEAINRLYQGFLQSYVQLQDTMRHSILRFSTQAAGKTRAFYITRENLDVVKENFFIQDDEEIIFAHPKAAMRKLIGIINASEGKKIFFIMVPNFPFAALTREGFVQGKDFVNGLKLLSDAQGAPLDSYPLILAM